MHAVIIAHLRINLDTDIYDIIQPNELDIMYEELNQPVTVDEVKNSIKQLKSGKSAGLDLLFYEFYIHGQELLAVPLCDLLAPAVTVGETEGAMDSTSVFFLPLLLPITL